MKARRIAGMLLVVGVGLAVACCGGKSSSPAAPATSSASVAPAPSTTVLSLPAYARALLGARRPYLARGPAQYALIAEALNLIAPPPGYALRHKGLIDEFLAVASIEDRRTSDPIRVSKAEALADVHLMNLAYELDPTAQP